MKRNETNNEHQFWSLTLLPSHIPSSFPYILTLKDIAFLDWAAEVWEGLGLVYQHYSRWWLGC